MRPLAPNKPPTISSGGSIIKQNVCLVFKHEIFFRFRLVNRELANRA